MSVRQRKADSGSHGGFVEAAMLVENRVEETLLVLWDDLPRWQRDNHYIRSGYRRASGSYWRSVTSLGYLHNEFVNIYTHLIGCFAFTATGFLLYSMIVPRYPTATYADLLAFACFFLGVALCLGMSATYHTISNHSDSVAKLGNQLDYVGIVFLITGSFVPSIYYGFYCEPRLRVVYWGMISSIGLGCAIVSILPQFRTPEWRPFRAGMFVAMGLSAVFPVLHGIELYGVGNMLEKMGLYWVVLQGFLYILGAAIYVARVPERLRPGTFDIWGSSHQIFHILVVAAASAHLNGLLVAFDYNHGEGGLKC